MKELVVIGYILMLFFGVGFAGFVIGCASMDGANNRELIKRGLKQYNTTTGVIEWVEKE